MSLRIGIIGCGLIGQKRANSLGDMSLVACADLSEDRAKAVAKGKAKVYTQWRELLADPQVEAVIIATLHDSLAEITLAAIQSGKHVLVEKPAARNSSELLPILDALKTSKIKVRVGFNHRFHRAMQAARELVDSGSLGELMYIRARYGHGGRPGYDREWRAQPKVSGGGELIDQGPHIIDLARWFLGDFSDINGFAHTYFWDMAVDDNGFLLLRNTKKQVAFLHASCTEWKNMFSMEIYGKIGKVEISGLGGSYGVERLCFYKMLPEMGPPETTIWEYPMADNSWALELSEFARDISLNRNSSPGINDAYQTLKIIEKIYQESGYDHRA